MLTIDIRCIKSQGRTCMPRVKHDPRIGSGLGLDGTTTARNPREGQVAAHVPASQQRPRRRTLPAPSALKFQFGVAWIEFGAKQCRMEF